MRKMLFGLTSGLLAAGLLVSSLAVAKPQPAPAPAGPPPGKGRFMGAHPLMARPGAGYCYIDVPHVHDYMPDKPTLYQPVGESYVFTGDPVPFGYEGNKTVFYGHHPVPLQAEAGQPIASPHPPTFCFMKGPHYHEYPVPEGPGFKAQNDVNFYIGPVPPEAARVRPQAEQALEIEYRPYVAQRPQVTVTPPAEWAGVTWVAPPPPAVVAAPPPVVVSAPPPQVVVAAPPPAVVVAAPQPQVVIAAPQPTVVVTPPQPVIIGPAGPGVIYMHGHGPGHGPGHWGKGPGRGPGPGPGWGKGKGKGHWKHW